MADRQTKPNGVVFHGDRRVPEAIDAERALIGACLITAEPCRVLVHELGPEDFLWPSHRLIAEAVIDLYKRGAAVDTLTVSNWLAERNLLNGIHDPQDPGATGAMALIGEMNSCPDTRHVETYAHLVAERSTRRRMLAMAAEAVEAAYDLTRPVDGALSEVMSTVRAMNLPARAEGPDDIDLLIGGPEEPYQWLVPNLIERGDRLILTGAESAGKSYTLAMLAVQLSAGIHPFRRVTFPPVRVLLVDVENGARMVRRRFTDFLSRLPRASQTSFGQPEAPGFDAGRLKVRVHEEWLDLTARNDRRWFTERIRANEPDVVFVGPLYKLHRGKATDEEPAQELAEYFDDLRATYGVTMIFEAHSPYGSDGGTHRTIRPYGPSIWSRWPEWGFCIRKAERQPIEKDPRDNRLVVDWEPWKVREGGRDWPKQLISGGRWPWTNMALLEETF